MSPEKQDVSCLANASMQFLDLTHLGVGALLGFAAAPHCMVMCSGIATTLALAGQSGSLERNSVLARSFAGNAGRIVSYAAAGAMVGFLGTAAFAGIDATLSNIALRWLAAILLCVVGLSIVGVMPAIIIGYPKRILSRYVAPGRCAGFNTASWLSAFAAGLVWGFLPCAMAYSALFYATLSGSAPRGLLTMSGFGLATSVPLLLSTLGVSVLATRASMGRTRAAFGLVLVAIGAAGTIGAVHDFGVWCRPS
jgi:sulfite exporter TauE/SafE